MPANLADVSTFTSPIVVPVDGDNRNAASVTPALQGLANRTAYLNNAVPNGSLDGASRVELGGPTGSLIISAIRSLVLGGYKLSSTGDLTVALPVMSANTWWYAYLYDNGAHAIAVEIVSDPPDAGLVHKLTGGTTLDPTRRYVCALRCTAASTARPFLKIGNRVTFRPSADGGQNNYRALNGGAAASWANVALAAWLPPHARLAAVRTRFHAADTVNALDFKTPGDSSETSDELYPATEAFGERTLITDTSQNIAYQVSGTGTLLYVFVAGYHEG